jgi:hypothetical protein
MPISSDLDPANPEEIDHFKFRVETPEIDPKILAKLKREKIGKIGTFIVYSVDDEYIRNWIDQDYVGAGNFARDAYIPEGEIWAAKTLRPSDLAPTLVHEAVEVSLMYQFDIDYEDAHDYANLFESKLRRRIRSKDLKIKDHKDAFREANKMIRQFVLDSVVKTNG